MKNSIGQTVKEAYAHHIQRLMITGNFALIAGIKPKEVCEWYLSVYADAYEWVELPNTHGMNLRKIILPLSHMVISYYVMQVLF